MTSSVRPAVPAADDLTAEWFTGVMHASGNAAVAAARLEPMTTADVGWFGRLLRAHLDHDPAGAGPATVVVKLDPEDAFVRDVGFRLGFFTREVGFYRDLSTSAPVRVPRCHFAAIDEETRRYGLVLEDLAAGRFGDQAAGCTAREAETVVTELAALHAWTPNTSATPWLPRFADTAPAFTATYATALETVVAYFGDRLPAAALAVGQRLAERLGALYEALGALPPVVLHNDCRLDNVVFELGDDPRPLVYDWQGVCLGPVAVDLASLLVLSLEPDVRRSTQDRILDRYRAELARLGVTIDATELAHGYALATVYQFALGVSAFAASPPGRPTFVAWVRRASEAVAEVDVDSLL